MQVQGLEILRNVKAGSNTFSFTVKEEKNRFKGVWYTVFVKQTTDMSELGEEDITITWKIPCLSSPTEHAAINYAGKKLIKDWKNIN